MPALRPEPDLFDLEGWQRRVQELEAEPQDDWRDALIDHAKAQVRAILASAEKSPPEAA